MLIDIGYSHNMPSIHRSKSRAMACSALKETFCVVVSAIYLGHIFHIPPVPSKMLPNSIDSSALAKINKWHDFRLDDVSPMLAKTTRHWREKTSSKYRSNARGHINLSQSDILYAVVCNEIKVSGCVCGCAWLCVRVCHASGNVIPNMCVRLIQSSDRIAYNLITNIVVHIRVASHCMCDGSLFSWSTLPSMQCTAVVMRGRFRTHTRQHSLNIVTIIVNTTSILLISAEQHNQQLPVTTPIKPT